MIDLHTHTIFSDGGLLPSELVRRALVNGYKAIGITDHVDASNIDFVLPRIIKAAETLNKHWGITVLPGVEITHAPLEEIPNLIKFARGNGAKIVVLHGETVSEPVLPGTNRTAIECGADILAHPGHLYPEDAALAAEKGVYIEITTRKNHSTTNAEVIQVAREANAKLVLNTDTHDEEDLINDKKATSFLKALKLTQDEIRQIFANSKELFRNRSRS
ncbi:MAG: histidinol phosphate phosphatase domain-containing protein [Candidatus Omnitrophica bacterium]|nr:histidinol phosphate phosphatase domain-containing protein [Candidatus Omnitrophota bacterium]